MASELEAAEQILKTGPGGNGWRFNETKRQDAEDLALFLRLLNHSMEMAAAR